MIASWLSEIEAIRRDARAVLDGLTSEQANQSPGSGRWSVAQNLLHVVKAAKPYLDRIEAALKAPTHDGPVRPGILAALLVKSLEPPPRLRVKTQRTLEPDEHLDVDLTLAEFDAVHERLAVLLRNTTEADLMRDRFRSPYLSIMHVRLDQAVRTLLAHARRHLWQARNARRLLGLHG